MLINMGDRAIKRDRYVQIIGGSKRFVDETETGGIEASVGDIIGRHDEMG